MDLRSINKYFGYAFIVLGVAKIIIMTVAIFYLIAILGNGFFSQLDVAITGGTAQLSLISKIRSIVELILLVGAVIMLIVNIIQTESYATLGYAIILGSALIEYCVPTIIKIFIFFAFGLAYIWGCIQLLDIDDGDVNVARRTSKKEIKETDWFFSDKEK